MVCRVMKVLKFSFCSPKEGGIWRSSNLDPPASGSDIKGRLKHFHSFATSNFKPMSADDFYWYASLLIFLPWLLLIIAPNWQYTEAVAFGFAIVLFLAAAIFTFRHLAVGEADGSLFSLEGLENLFRSKEMLLTGWLNYLSFCLLVGTWQTHDARHLKIGHIFVIPSLLLTMLTGPAGLLLYLVVRFFRTKKWEV